MIIPAKATFRCMPRDIATTRYIRMRLQSWRDERGDLLTPLAISKLTGAKPSAISQIRSGKLGVGPAVIVPLAKAWKMTYGELVDAAKKWADTHGAEVDAVLDEASSAPEQAEAIETIRSLGRVNDEQIRAIIAAFGSRHFVGRSREWWIATILGELEYMRKTQAYKLAEERAVKGIQGKIRKKKRELAKEKAPSAKAHNTGPHTRKAG